MEAVFFALLFAVALWLGDLYSSHKFRHFYPASSAHVLSRKAPRWKKFFVYKNQLLKHIGLFMVWAGVTAVSHLSDSSEHVLRYVLYGVVVFGLALYVASRLWPLAGNR